jgi:tRNA dimethylallyltransferase
MPVKKVSPTSSGVLRLPERLVVIAGPTASGKSELAVEVAEAIGGEIVGADSRQIYRYMDAGTAKPAAAQRERVPHHLIDVVDPDESYDVARWRSEAMSALAAIHARGAKAVVCGGTGLYLRSLTRGLFAGPPADEAIRARLEAEEKANPGSLHARLLEIDAPSARRIHSNDFVRIVRALEVFEATGRPLSAWLLEHALSEKPFETLTIEIDAGREALAGRVIARSRAMVRAGIVDELKGLYDRGYDPATRAFDAIGYRQAADCIAGRLAASELADAITLATMQYVKRQRTWMRGQMNTRKVAIGDGGEALRLASEFHS